MDSIDREIARLAGGRHGLVTRKELSERGIGRKQINHRLATGKLHRIHRGIYAVGHRSLTQNGLRLAAVLACGPGAILSHRDAAELWGLVTVHRPATDVTVPGRSGGGPKGVQVHESGTLVAEDLTVVEGVPVTRVERVLLDLADVVHPHVHEQAMDQAERRELVDPRRLGRLIARSNGRRGVRALRELAAVLRPETAELKSELERDFLRECRRAGLPEPWTNAEIGSFEVDAAWSEARLVVELDAFGTHASRRRFERDRERDEALHMAGFLVHRISRKRFYADRKGAVAVVRALLGARGEACR